MIMFQMKECDRRQRVKTGEVYLHSKRSRGGGTGGRGSGSMTSHSDVGFGAAAVRGRSRPVDVVASCSLIGPRHVVAHVAARQSVKSVTSCLTRCRPAGGSDALSLRLVCFTCWEVETSCRSSRAERRPAGPDRTPPSPGREPCPARTCRDRPVTRCLPMKPRASQGKNCSQ